MGVWLCVYVRLVCSFVSDSHTRTPTHAHTHTPTHITPPVSEYLLEGPAGLTLRLRIEGMTGAGSLLGVVLYMVYVYECVYVDRREACRTRALLAN